MSTGGVVLFDEREGPRGGLGVATLNNEATLNALSLEMVDLLDPQLRQWAARDDISGVLIRGAGARAFCAGGDIQNLYHAMRSNLAAGHFVDDTCEQFFEREYRLDYLIHTYPKPIACLGHGIVIGGGLGLFSASRVRLATPRTRISIPEVTIGLFPDAGASWFLRGLPPHRALFLGATGARLNAADAVFLGLATDVVADGADVVEMLTSGQVVASDDDLGPGNLAPIDAALAAALPAVPDSVDDLKAALAPLSAMSEWADAGIAAMNAGCPMTLGILLEQVRRVAQLSLADAFRMEMTVASQCARHGDFPEGVRALLIDKDNRPQWQPYDDTVVGEHFVSPWDINPLHDLGDV